jgi:hypothetical protein
MPPSSTVVPCFAGCVATVAVFVALIALGTAPAARERRVTAIIKSSYRV